MKLVIAPLLLAGAAICQTVPPPAFEVASIKISPGRSTGNPMMGDDIRSTPGSLTLRHVTLKACIQWAYHVFGYQVSGPGWIDSDHYDIAAKAAGPSGDGDLRNMLQALLADRFQLTLHRQTREAQAFVLSVGKNGPKFQESKTEGEGDIQPDQKTMSVAVRRISVSQIIDPLARIFQMPVVDMTGLKGRYDLTINMAQYIPQSGEKADPVAIIQAALQQELGLRLEAKKLPLDFLIVDHATKAPVEN